MRVDPHYISGLVGSLNDAVGSEQQISAELSSGLRVTSAAVDPVAAGQASLLGTSISQDDTFVQNAGTTEGLMQISDSALGSVVSQLTSAISLATAGNSGTKNATDLVSISQQLSGIRDEIVSLANTSYQGSYVFAGSRGNTPPFAIDSTTTPATAIYSGDTNVSSITTPAGVQIQTGLAGSAVFTAPGGNVLAALNKIIADFATGTASSTSASDIGAISAGLSNVSDQRSTLDGALGRLQNVTAYTQTDETQKTVAQSSLVSADTATVATQLSAVTTQTQALMSVISTLEKGSLFDDTH